MDTETVQSAASALDYDALLVRHQWIVERERDCVVSPDSDGLLCGLFMSHHLGWRIRGLYDGKVLLVRRGINPRSCVFLDMEIYRQGVRSIGQHMLMYDRDALPDDWNAFSGCISANNLRNADFQHNFKNKYPFGTIHLLAAIVAKRQKVIITKEAISTLLYADGTFKNQFNYPENCLEWLRFLGAQDSGSPLQRIFLDPHHATYELMVALRDLFVEFSRIGGGRRGGDKIKISDAKGNTAGLDRTNTSLTASAIAQAESLLALLGGKTGWAYDRAHWTWGPYAVRRFRKGSIKPGKGRHLALLAKHPLSFAIISRNSIEFTIDRDGVF